MGGKGIIIAAKAAMNSGKTTAVLGVWEWLKEQKSDVIREEIHDVHDTGKLIDITSVLEYQGIRIGISSKGDPGMDQEGILNGFIQDKCHIIVCACRTKLSTKEPIDALQDTWDIRYIGPAEDGYICKEKFLDEVKDAIQEAKGEKTMKHNVWKVGSRWSECGAPEATIADIFKRYNVAFAYTDAFLETKPGDLLAVGDGENIIAIGIILSPAKSMNQLDIVISEKDKKRIDFEDDNVCGCIVRYHWFEDYSRLDDKTLIKRMSNLKYIMGRFCHAPAIRDEVNEIFYSLEKLEGLAE